MSLIYNEKYINTARTIEDLIKILSELPSDTCVDVAASDYMSNAEVWYDEDVNTVILK